MVYHGRGFVVLRGLKPSSYTDEDNVIIYLGVTSYIASERAEVLGEHVCWLARRLHSLPLIAAHIHDRTSLKLQEEQLAPSDLAVTMVC